jgi:hypothetical protein
MDSFTQYLTKQLVTAFALGVFVGVGGFWAIDTERGISGFFDDENALAEQGLDELGAETGQDIEIVKKELLGSSVVSIARGENNLVVANQPAGISAIMSMVSLSQNSWVAIHEENEDGTIGNILGARRFDTGRYFGEEIELLRGTVGGRMYVAVVHADDGDSIFDHEIEVPLQGISGDNITAKFLATAHSEL